MKVEVAGERYLTICGKHMNRLARSSHKDPQHRKSAWGHEVGARGSTGVRGTGKTRTIQACSCDACAVVAVEEGDLFADGAEEKLWCEVVGGWGAELDGGGEGGGGGVGVEDVCEEVAVLDADHGAWYGGGWRGGGLVGRVGAGEGIAVWCCLLLKSGVEG